MPTAIKKDFHVKKGVETPSLKIGTQEVTSLLDSSTVSSTLQSPAVSKQIMNDGGATTKIYDSADLLPAAGNDSGDFAYIYSTNRLYLWNGSGWYNIALINTAPGISGADSSYSLTSALNVDTISALQVTLVATDPEGLPITFSAVGSDSASSFVDITQDSSVTTITPKNRRVLALGDSAGGNFSITFKASDGTFIAPFVSSFTLQFPESYALFALSEIQKLQSNDIAAGDEFGQDVALSDQANYAIVGAWKEDEKASDAGAAYIFAKSGNSLVQQAKLMAGDGTSSDSFGYSVDINKTGTYAVVGAKAADPSSGGAAYIYKRTGTSWSEVSKINRSSGAASGDWYGVSVAISNSGDRVVVGSHNRSSGTGAAYVYKEGTGTHDVTNVGGGFISISNSFSSQNSTPRAFAFNANGTKIYIIGSGGTPSVYQYSLSTAYDTSTWTYDSVSFAVNTQISAPADIHFNTNGTKMFISGQHSGSSGVWQYTLSTGFDLSTASYSNVTLDVNSQDSGMHGMTMNPAGTKMVLAGNTNNKVYGYNLSTAFDLSTASYASEDYNVGSQEATPQDVIFNGDGTKMFVCGTGSDDVHIYNLSTAYDVSSSTFVETVNYGNSYSYGGVGGISSLTGMNFNPDGSKFYLSCVGLDRILQFSALEQYSLEQELVRSPSSTSHYYGYSVDMDDDGDTVVIGSYGNSKAYVWKKSGFGITNVSQHVASYNLRGTPNELEDQHGIAFNSDGTKAFIVGTGGDTGDLVLQYILSTAYDLSTASYNNVKLSVASQTSYPSGIFFKTDGTKMFISSSTDQASGTKAVFQYSLSTAFDLSTASYDNVSIDLRGSSEGDVDRAFSLAFKPDGTKLFIVNNPYPVNPAIFEYDLSTAWDISTFSYNSKNVSLSSQANNFAGIAFNSDGTEMYANSTTGFIFKYNLSTAYDVSTASYSNTSVDLSSQSNNSRGITFTPDGSKLFVCSTANDDIDEYGNMLWTQQVQLAGSQATSASEYFGRSVSISEDGLTVLVGAEREAHSSTTRPGAGYIFKYGTANYQVANATHDHSSPAISQDTQPSACLFNGDGTKVFVFGYQNDKIYQYNLSTAYDVSSSSMSYVSGSDITLSDFSGDPSGARWNNDGTKLFIIDKTNDQLHQYTLSVAYDLSSLSYDGYASVSQATTAFGFDFNGDGTKVFVVDRSNDRIYQYSMTTAYDYSTLTYDSVYTSTTDGNTDPFSIAFNSTGTRYFVTDDDSTARIHIYECANPYDLSDTEHIGTFAVNSQELYPKQITFSPDGSKMFLVGNDADKIQRYNVQTTNAWYQEARLQQANANYQDWMGSKASISGDGTIAVLGASYAQIPNVGDGYGRLNVFTRSTTGLWTEAAQRRASDMAYMDRFGLGVSISPDGRYVLVGAPQEDTNGSDAGKAYFMKAPQNQFPFPWQVALGTETKIEGQVAGEYFGYSVALDQYGDRAAIGAQYGNFGGQSYTGVGYVYERSGSTWSQQARLGPSDGVNGDRFGTGVALSLDGKIAAFGAYLEDPENRSDAGSVYIYEKPSTYDGTSWSDNQAWEMGSVGQTREANDRLGYSVAIDGDYLIAGMSYGGPDVSGTNGAGSAAIFVKTGGTYAFQTELTGQWTNGSDLSGGGRAVAISGTRAYVGAPNYDGQKGRVAVYTRSGTTWTHQANITGSTGSQNLGASLMASGDTVIIGEPYNDTGGSNRGRAYVYTGNNTLEATLTASDAIDNAYFGYSVGIHGDLAVVGAPNHDSAKGQAYVFERSGTTWTQKAILTAFAGGVSNQGAATDNNDFGWVVDCFKGTSTNTIVVSSRVRNNGNKGYVYVFEGSGTSYSGKHRIQASDIANDDYFGCGAADCGALRIDKTPANNGDYIAVGAYQNDENNKTNSGTVYVFKRSDSTFDPYISGGRAWTEVKKLHQFGNPTTAVDGPTANAYFGYALALENANLVVGAYGYGAEASASQCGVLYSFDGLGWSQTVKTHGGTASSQHFGQSIDLNSDGTIMAVGAPNESYETTNAGALYVMKKQINYQVMDMTHVGFTTVNSDNNDTTDMAFNSDGTKLYHVGTNTNRVVEYDLSTAYDVSTKTYNSVNFLPSAGGYNTGIRWKPDGTKIFVLSHTNNGGGTATVHRYGLSTPFDLSTVNATAEQTYDARDQLNRAWGFTFKPDGTKMFISDDNGNDINEYSLSTAWDLTTGSYVTNFSVSSQESQPSGLEFNADGKVLYMSGFGNDRIYKYNLSTAYDISTMGYSSEYISVSSQSSQPGGIKFQPDGSKLFMACISSNGVDTYDTSGVSYENVSKPTRSALVPNGQTTNSYSYMGWDVAMNSSATRIIAGAYKDGQSTSTAGAAYIFTGDGTGSFTVEAKLRPPTSPSPSGAQFGHSVDITEDGNTVVVGSKMDPEKGSQRGSATIYNRLPPEYYAVEDFTHLGFYSLTDGSVANITDIAWNNDGTKFFSIAYSGDVVNEYSVSTAYDVSTKTYVRNFDLSSETNYPTGITFNTDGTKMFITHPTGIGGGTNGLFQYNLTTGFDLSTASYANIALSRDSYTNDRAWGVSFKPDGTKMFISDDGGDDIRQFTLSTPFDLSTISSYDSTTDLYVGSQDGSVRGHAFNGDGTKLYVVGDQNDRIHIYNLSTAYDVSTGSYDTYKSLSSQTNNPSGIKFNPDGSKMYISCIQSEGVDQYSVIKQDWDSGYKIFHPDPTNTDYFGVSVSISGDGKTVSVGCERDDTKTSDAGAVLVYHRGEEVPTNNGTGSNYLNGNGTSVSYHHVKTITASDGANSDYLSAGQDRAQALEMSKNGEYIIAGTYRASSNAGKTYIFKNT